MAMTFTRTVDSMYASTWRKCIGETVNQIFGKTRLLSFLNSKKKIMPRGGKELQWPVLAERGNAPTWFGADGELGKEGDDATRVVRYYWKYLGGSVKQVFTHTHQNAGPQQIMDMVKDSIELARLEISQEFEEAFNGDGSTTNGPNGYKNLISTSPTSSLTVGGWDQATYPWWQNQQYALSGDAVDYLRKDLYHLWLMCATYGPEPDFSLCDRNAYELLLEVLEEKHQFMSDSMKDLGWPETAIFAGKPIIWSKEAEAETIRVVNLTDNFIFYDPNLWMKMGKWIEAQGNVNRVAHILSGCNMVSRRRATSGVLTAVDG